MSILLAGKVCTCSIKSSSSSSSYTRPLILTACKCFVSKGFGMLLNLSMNLVHDSYRTVPFSYLSDHVKSKTTSTTMPFRRGWNPVWSCSMLKNTWLSYASALACEGWHVGLSSLQGASMNSTNSESMAQQKLRDGHLYARSSAFLLSPFFKVSALRCCCQVTNSVIGQDTFRAIFSDSLLSAIRRAFSLRLRCAMGVPEMRSSSSHMVFRRLWKSICTAIVSLLWNPMRST
mmetsp:Transcript_62825/g.175573  ORF Transcript_62825/g.175573 Transcript_62825/m.175573 type:complete len:232 (+) Transcript_62825:1194-1889(+)